MIKEKLLEIAGGIIVDFVKDSIKQHKALKTPFLKMFNEATTLALKQLYPNQEEREKNGKCDHI